MPDDLSPSAQRVQRALTERGHAMEVVELPATTRTAADAASAVGCEVGQIAKSLVFRGQADDEPLLVIASGANRVDEGKLSEHAGQRVEIASADYVRQRTGFAIGGVPPVGYSEELRTFIDEDLLLFEGIWAAAGNPRAVFRLHPDDLVSLTGGQVVAIH